MDLMHAWQVPAENLFMPRRGHFSAALGLYHDPAPFDRLRAVLAAAGIGRDRAGPCGLDPGGRSVTFAAGP